MGAREELQELEELDALAARSAGGAQQQEQPTGAMENFASPLKRFGERVMSPVRVGGVDVNPIPGLYGAAETLTSLGTAIPAAVASGFYGAGKELLTGEKQTEPTFTPWQPRTEAGQTQMRGLGNFIDRSGIASLPPIMGVSGVAQVPSRMNLQQIAAPLNKALVARSAAKADQLADISRLDAPRLDALKVMRENGVAAAPSAMTPGVLTGTLESVAGKEITEQSLMAKNQPIIQNLARQEMQIAANQPLVNDVYQQVRSRPEVVAPYQAISRLPATEVDDVFRGDVANLNRLSGFNDEVKDVLKSDRVEAITSKIQNLNALAGDEALALIRDFRDKSKNLHQQIKQGTGGADAGESALVKVYDDAAEIVENQLERRAMATGDIDLVRDLRKSRKLIATSYQYEKATDLGTGNLDASVFAKRLSEGLPTEGNMRAIGMMAGQFPDSFGTPGMRSTHSMGMGAAGGAQNLFQYPIRRATAGVLTSDFMQERLRRGVKDNRPVREQLGYTPFQSDDPGAVSWERPPALPVTSKLSIASEQDGLDYSGFQAERAAQNLLAQKRPDTLIAREQAANTARQVAVETAAESQSKANRLPVSGGMPFDLDPVTGRLRPADAGLRGATPSAIESTGNNLNSAVNKMTKGQSFAMSAEERVAWNARKAELVKANPEFRGLSDADIAQKVSDRGWVADRIQALKSEYADWATDAAARFNAEKAAALNEKANNPSVLSKQERQSRKAANSEAARRMELSQEVRRAEMQANVDMLESMSDKTDPRSGTLRDLGQGPKTRAALRDLLK